MAVARRAVGALLLLAASRAGGAGGPIHVVVAASRNHYAGLLAVVASAANATGADAARLRFLLLVDGAGDATAVGAAAACAAGDSGARVDARAFALSGPLAAADRSRTARLGDALNYARGRAETRTARAGRRGRASRGTSRRPRARARARARRVGDTSTQARFFVGDLLPEARRAIYLDADVVVEASLAGLDGAAAAAFAANASAVLAAAPRDFKRVCDHLVNCGAAAVRARFADPARALHAFNAGVVVFDLDRWRVRRLAADVERWVIANAAADPPIYRLGSNPPLVLAVGEDWARLDPRWNCMRGIHRQHPHNTACWRDAFVRHYPGGAKPWAMAPADAAALGWRFPRRAACAADLERRAEAGVIAT